MAEPLQYSNMNELEKRIAEAFDIFDYIGDKFIEVAYVGTILRFIGCVPTEDDISEVIKATEDQEKKGEIAQATFIHHVAQKIIERRWEPANAERLLEAFRELDPENRSYLDVQEFTKFMKEEGDQFNDEEIQKMLTCAVEPLEGNIPYEFYIHKLAYHPKDSIYDIAQQFGPKPEPEKRQKSAAGLQLPHD